MTPNFIAEAISSFGEIMNLVKYPNTEEEYIKYATPKHGVKITKTWAEVKVRSDSLKAEYDSKQYQRNRRARYPSIGEQLDQIYWDKKNGTKNWEETIDAVKAEHPKP